MSNEIEEFKSLEKTGFCITEAANSLLNNDSHPDRSNVINSGAGKALSAAPHSRARGLAVAETEVFSIFKCMIC